LVALMAGYEYVRIIRQAGFAPSYVVVITLIILLMVDGQWPQYGILLWCMALVPLLALTIQVFRGNAPGSLASWALEVAGGVYVGLSMSFFVRLRALDDGMLWLVLALLGTWACDSGAYFVGIRFGKRRFFSAISPKKTFEGAIGGLIFGLLAIVLLGHWLVSLPIGWGVVLGLALVLAATFGDLSESVVKRQVGVKDSGNIIPGHGGALDRVDSLLYVVPVVYLFAVSVSRLAW
jgi:phosphatidate cytidylyltransferase